MPIRYQSALLLIALVQSMTPAPADPAAVDLRQRALHNKMAYIPPQCYTKTRDDDGGVHNPCYVCHTRSRRPNYVNDDDLQLAYSLPAPATTNPWTNLFTDRSAAVAEISDTEIRTYIRQSNYFDAAGRITPALRLAMPPTGWDFDNDHRWQGFVPDAQFNFDDDGFDRATDSEPTGWRAFAYHPFPGTFWPTNGSTGDVLIRLPEVFRRKPDGRPDLAVYRTNLAIVEAMIREEDVSIPPVDEASMGSVDLDKDGRIGTAEVVRYDWAPLEGRRMWYVGEALQAQRDGKVHLAAGLYPEGTEFLHTVRYIDTDAAGDNQLAARIKEVRYARKDRWLNYGRLEAKAAKETREKSAFPDRPRFVRGNRETGVSNDLGWTYAGMIEDADGDLRPQSYEELVSCVGCHGGIGATTDASFAFPRKIKPGTRHDGWYHWSRHGLRGLPERLRADGEPEYAYYLSANGAGDEFRANSEVRGHLFDAQGALDPTMRDRLQTDVSLLLQASPERAMQLNKAYRVIVREQRFTAGRDATTMPLQTVYREVDDRDLTGVTAPLPGR